MTNKDFWAKFFGNSGKDVSPIIRASTQATVSVRPIQLPQPVSIRAALNIDLPFVGMMDALTGRTFPFAPVHLPAGSYTSLREALRHLRFNGQLFGRKLETGSHPLTTWPVLNVQHADGVTRAWALDMRNKRIVCFGPAAPTPTVRVSVTRTIRYSR